MLKRLVVVFLSCSLVCSTLMAQEQRSTREELIDLKLELLQQREILQSEIDAIEEKLAIPFFCKEDNQLYGKIGVTVVGFGALYWGLRDINRINTINREILAGTQNGLRGQAQTDRPFILKGEDLEKLKASDKSLDVVQAHEKLDEKRSSNKTRNLGALFRNQSAEFNRLSNLARFKVYSGLILSGLGIGSMFVDLNETFDISCGDAKSLVESTNNALEDFAIVENIIDLELQKDN